jgi:hypothetical protein
MCEIMAWCEVCCAGGEQTGVLAWTNVRGGLLVVLKVFAGVSNQGIKSRVSLMLRGGRGGF